MAAEQLVSGTHPTTLGNTDLIVDALVEYHPQRPPIHLTEIPCTPVDLGGQIGQRPGFAM